MSAEEKPGGAESRTQAFIEDLPEGLALSPEAAVALVLARELDDGNSATSKSMCAKAHLEIMGRLRELAPPEETKDALNDIEAQRVKRLARLPGAAG